MKRSTFNDDGHIIHCNELQGAWFEHYDRNEKVRTLAIESGDLIGGIELSEENIRRLKDLCQFVLVTQSFEDKEKSK